MRDIVIAYRTNESLLARHRAGGPHALFWLEQALDYEEDGAVERAAKLVRAGGEMGQASFLLLSQKPTSAWLPLLGIDGAWSALRAVTELPQDRRDHYAVYDLPDLVRYLEENGGPEAGAEARRLVWEFFATTESPDRRHSHLEKFRKQAFTPPPAFEGHELAWHRLLEGNLSIGKSNEVRDYVRLLTEMGEPFFDALFAVFPDLWPGSRARILRYLAEVYAEGDEGGDLPPPAYDAAWLAFLSSPLFLEGQLPVLAFHIRAALRSGDERTSAILRRYVAARGWRGFTPEDALFRALLDWEHPDRIDFLEAFLDDPDLPPTHGRNPLDLLATAEDALARELLIRIARDTKHRHAFAAVSALTRLRIRDEIVAIFAHLEEPWEGLPGSYRHALIYAAQSFQLREAIPFLLEEFRRGGNNATSAAKAMDSIRAYHDRLQAFEAYADGREDVRSAELERLLGLLEDEDPELRRAAVLALAAMGRTDALPRILALAKDDPDERVRQAALDAVEKMAR